MYDIMPYVRTYMNAYYAIQNLFAAGPDQVMNVRVYVYNPVFNSDNITALVVWNPLSQVAAGGIVNKYIVDITNVETDQRIIVSKNSIRNVITG